MPFHVTIGIKASSIEVVSQSLSRAVGQTPEAHESLYLGEYDLFRLPEEVSVKYNFVEGEGEWDYPEYQDYKVLVVSRKTDRPEYIRAIAEALGFECHILEERFWGRAE